MSTNPVCVNCGIDFITAVVFVWIEVYIFGIVAWSSGSANLVLGYEKEAPQTGVLKYGWKSLWK